MSSTDAPLRALVAACEKAGLRVSGPWPKPHGLELHVWNGDQGGPVVKLAVDGQGYRAAIEDESFRPIEGTNLGDAVAAVRARATIAPRT